MRRKQLQLPQAPNAFNKYTETSNTQYRSTEGEDIAQLILNHSSGCLYCSVEMFDDVCRTDFIYRDSVLQKQMYTACFMFASFNLHRFTSTALLMFDDYMYKSLYLL